MLLSDAGVILILTHLPCRRAQYCLEQELAWDIGNLGHTLDANEN